MARGAGARYLAEMDDLAAEVARGLGPVPDRLAVAVSGGGDSVALLLLLHDLMPGRIVAVTVDHGLRAASAAEAAAVAAQCAPLGIPHAVLRWEGWDGRGNLMDAARRARRRLIGEWAVSQGIGAVALGHTADDQAETVLMRLARGSGVDGLAGMAARSSGDGVTWLRPLLGVRREVLREFLRGRGVTWAEDPTNNDPRFDRTRARLALGALALLGIGVEDLTETAARMAMAREVLERAAFQAAEKGARIEAGDVVLDRAVLAVLAEETRLRLVAQAVRWVTGADYRPRFAALRSAVAAALEGRRATLAGALIAPRRGALWIGREPRAAMASPGVAPGEVWDGRWRLDGPGDVVRALGQAVADCPDAKGSGLSRTALMASPALWNGAVLVAAPLAGYGPTVRLEPARDAAGFFTSLLSH